jgi:hypothetical protein
MHVRSSPDSRKQLTVSIKTQESDLDKHMTMAAIIAAIGIKTKLQRSTMMASKWKPFCHMIIANECKYDNPGSSEQDTERDTEQLRYGYRIGPEGDPK